MHLIKVQGGQVHVGGSVGRRRVSMANGPGGRLVWPMSAAFGELLCSVGEQFGFYSLASSCPSQTWWDLGQALENLYALVAEGESHA